MARDTRQHRRGRQSGQERRQRRQLRPEGRDVENARRLREAGDYCPRHDGPARWKLVARESGELLCLDCLTT
jgi:hypothetical protein